MSLTDFPRADLALARRIERGEGAGAAAYIDSKRRLWPESGAARIDVAGAFVLFDGADSPVTQTFGLGMTEPVTDAVLGEIEDWYAERGAQALHEVSPQADPSALAKLTERGYQPFEFSSMLYRPTADAPIASGAGLTARPAREDETETWTDAAVEGWSEFGDLRALLTETARINFEHPDTHPFLVEQDDRVIAAGALGVHGDTALLAGAATIPAARRRGAQGALLEARLRFAADNGASVAVMSTLPGSASQRNAERNGFRIAYTRIKWRLPT